MKKKRGLNGVTTIPESRNDQPKLSGKIPNKNIDFKFESPEKWVKPSNFTNPHAVIPHDPDVHGLPILIPSRGLHHPSLLIHCLILMVP